MESARYRPTRKRFSILQVIGRFCSLNWKIGSDASRLAQAHQLVDSSVVWCSTQDMDKSQSLQYFDNNFKESVVVVDYVNTSEQDEYGNLEKQDRTCDEDLGENPENSMEDERRTNSYFRSSEKTNCAATLTDDHVSINSSADDSISYVTSL